jgi:xanthine dehydrogenase YagS FAD-binding subunit
MINFTYSRPVTIQGAIESLMKEPGATYIAGGTNLIDLMKRRVVSPQKLVDINGLPLRTIEKRPTGMYIGSLVTNSALAAHPMIKDEYPLVARALEAGASPQLRNMATVGGNMLQRTRCTYFYDTALPCNKREPGSGCGALKGYNRMHAIFGNQEHCIAVHPSDMCVALAALDTTVVIQGPKGERRVPFADFHRLPGDTPQKDHILERGELILGIEISRNPFKENVHYLKIRDRASYAFALVSVAVALEIKKNVIQDARLAMGGVAHKPWRLYEAEKFLRGKQVSAAAFRGSANVAMKGARGYGHNDFKLKMAPAVIAEALHLAAKV